MLVTKQLLVAIGFHSIEKNYYGSQLVGYQHYFICAQQKKETHTVLEEHEGE